MWKKVEEVFSATILDPINTKMNEIAGELMSATTFFINTFADELENFVRDQLNNLERFVPLDNLMDFAANVQILYDNFKSSADSLLASGTTVTAADGVRAALPVVMKLAQRLLEHPGLKAAADQVEVLADAMNAVNDGAEAIKQHAQTLREVDSSLTLISDLPQGDANGFDTVGLYISVFSELEPYLEEVHKHVFNSIRSSSFATSMMGHAEGGLNLAVEFCKHSETVDTLHTTVNGLHDTVHANTVLNKMREYVSFFTGSVIFDYLGQFDDKVTDGCDTVTGITDAYDSVKQSFTTINNLVQSTSSYSDDLVQKLLRMPGGPVGVQSGDQMKTVLPPAIETHNLGVCLVPVRMLTRDSPPNSAFEAYRFVISDTCQAAVDDFRFRVLRQRRGYHQQVTRDVHRQLRFVCVT